MAKKSPDSNTIAIAIDVGATNLRVAIVASTGKILKKKIVRTVQNGKDGVIVTDQIVRSILALGSLQKYNVLGIGCSVAGPLRKKGAGFDPTNLDFDYVPLVKPLEERFGVPVHVLNDTKAAVLAEYRIGAGGKGSLKNTCYITISSGIGCGAVVDGRLLCGRDGSAGEMGHTSVDVSFLDGRHDWEFYAAGKSILAFFDAFCISRGQDGKVYRSPKALYGARDRDPMVRKFLDEVGHVNAQGVHNVILAYNPEVIVFGGSVAQGNWDVFIKGVRKHIRRDVMGPLPKMILTKLGDEISLIGVGIHVHEVETEK